MYVTLSQYPMENIMDDLSLYRLQTVIYHQKKGNHKPSHTII